MNETPIHVVGNVVDVPRRNRLSTGSVTNFRMASTSRRFDEETRTFVDGSTLWIDVACWGELGGNVARSISKGDPVLVVGTIATDSWETDAGRRSATKLKASAVGLNLARGWAEFKRAARPDQAAGGPAGQEPADQEPADQGPADQGPADQGPADQTPPAEDQYAGRSTDYTRSTDYPEGEEALDEMDSDVTGDREAVPALT